MLYYTKTIDHQAHITAEGYIQTYSDDLCTQPINDHEWGNFNTSSGNDAKSMDFYVRNEGNTEVNVTWTALGFTSYNATGKQYETSSWMLYLAKVDGSEVRLSPENATSPDKLHLYADEVAHLKFYLVAIGSSPPEDFVFHTSFNSKDS